MSRYRPEYNREYRRRPENRGVCGVCGGPMGVQAKPHDGTCSDCRREARHSRERRIAYLWERGWTQREIADELETTRGSIGVQIAQMRREGWDLPYHYAANARKAGAA